MKSWVCSEGSWHVMGLQKILVEQPWRHSLQEKITRVSFEMLKWVKKTYPKNYLGPQSPFKTKYSTVDGQNPAPPRMMIIPWFIGFLTILGGCLGFLPSTVLLVLPLFIFVITLFCFCWLQLLRSTNHDTHRTFVYKKPSKPRPTLPYYLSGQITIWAI